MCRWQGFGKKLDMDSEQTCFHRFSNKPEEQVYTANTAKANIKQTRLWTGQKEAEV